MSRPKRYLLRMMMFLGAVALVAGFLFPAMESAFLANAGLNGLILGVLLIGVALNLRRVLSLRAEVEWIEGIKRGQVLSESDSDAASPRLLAPVARMLGERRDRITLSALGLRSILDSIAARLDENRDISRYFIGLSIFLGLLGTFWGLLQTVDSIAGVIGTLSIAAGDIETIFDDLKHGLEAPLGGMGTAFSSSLFGLSGALVLGFLDLQATQAQNRFYQELEEWLAGQTRLTSGGGGFETGEASVPAYIQALLEQTADSLDNLSRIIAREEEGRSATAGSLHGLTEKLSTLTDQMRTEQTLMLKLAEGQAELRPVLAKLADAVGRAGPSGGMDETTRGHIRSIDAALTRLVDENLRGRDILVREMRNEFKFLARTMAAIADEAERGL